MRCHAAAYSDKTILTIITNEIIVIMQGSIVFQGTEMKKTTDDKSITLLYVEDEADTRDLVISILHLRFPWLALLTADDGQEGLDLFNAHHPEIVLTDIRMPFLDGIRMANKIKRIYKKTQIIVLTAVDNIDAMLNASDIGINHFLLKPIVVKNLIAVVENCIEMVNMRRDVRHQKWLRRISPRHGVERLRTLFGHQHP
jgi:YesN/AraC family two-component response regulator